VVRVTYNAVLSPGTCCSNERPRRHQTSFGGAHHRPPVDWSFGRQAPMNAAVNSSTPVCARHMGISLTIRLRATRFLTCMPMVAALEVRCVRAFSLLGRNTR
jgi:hypothetical protein